MAKSSCHLHDIKKFIDQPKRRTVHSSGGKRLPITVAVLLIALNVKALFTQRHNASPIESIKRSLKVKQRLYPEKNRPDNLCIVIISHKNKKTKSINYYLQQYSTRDSRVRGYGK